MWLYTRQKVNRPKCCSLACHSDKYNYEMVSNYAFADFKNSDNEVHKLVLMKGVLCFFFCKYGDGAEGRLPNAVRQAYNESKACENKLNSS